MEMLSMGAIKTKYIFNLNRMSKRNFNMTALTIVIVLALLGIGALIAYLEDKF